jgi:hypothetical protein
MKIEQLYEAIGYAREDFLLASEKKRRGNKALFISLVSALLIVTLVMGAGTLVFQAVQKSSLFDPFSGFNFAFGAQTPAKEPIGIGRTVSSKEGTLYYQSEGDHSLTLILEKYTDKELQLYMRFSRSYVKYEDESHTEYGYHRLTFTTDPVVLALFEKATDEGVRIFVNGEEKRTIPKEKGRYEIVIDFGQFYRDDYEIGEFFITSFERMRFRQDYKILAPGTYCEMPYYHGKDELGRASFTFTVSVSRWAEGALNVVEQLYIHCENFPLDEITYGGKPLEKRKIGSKDYFLLDLSGQEVTHGLNIPLLMYFDKDAFAESDRLFAGTNTAYVFHRLQFSTYLNGITEEHRQDLYLSVRYDLYPDEKMIYYTDLSDLPPEQIYAVPTDFFGGEKELVATSIIRYPERELFEIRYCLREELYRGELCIVTVGAEPMLEKTQRIEHGGVTYYYAYGESGTDIKPLTVEFYLDAEDQYGADQGAFVRIYTDLEKGSAEEFIKQIQIVS